jgi:cell division septation protein DedD
MRGDRELYRDKIEVSLDGKQVFYLFFGAAVVACLVFVLGVMVGRRLESRAHADAVEAMEAASSDPLAALDLLAAGDGADDLSFPRELRADQPDAPPAPVEGEEGGEDGESGEGEDGGEDEDAAEEKAAAEEKRAAEKRAAEKRAAEKRAAEKLAAEKKAAEKRAAEAAEREAAGNWTLQLSSFQDEAEATTFYNKLESAGYSPFITRAEVPDKGTWFRVRLGRYPDYDSAIAAKAEFEKTQQIIAYVTRL